MLRTTANSNIFVVGATKTGKTTLSREMAKTTGFKVVSTSEWVKRRFTPSAEAQRDDKVYLNEITRFSCEELKRDPNACVDYIRHTYPIENGGLIIEGLRNPRDFAHLFRPHLDVVILLHYSANPIAASQFESWGVENIREQVAWYQRVGMLDPYHVLALKIASREFEPPPYLVSRDEIPGPPGDRGCRNFDEVVIACANIHERFPKSSIEEPRTGVVHVEIQPFDAWVADRVLYDDNDTRTGWSPCRVFAVSSYPGHVITFQIMLDSGAVFSYVPPHRLGVDCRYDRSSEPLSLDEAVYHNCRESAITVTSYSVLFEKFGRKSTRVYLRGKAEWRDARYILTVDWYRGNDLLHLLALDDGQLVLLPSHKVLFGAATDEMPSYKKLHAEWRLED